MDIVLDLISYINTVINAMSVYPVIYYIPREKTKQISYLYTICVL